jgi:hypothetical protein
MAGTLVIARMALDEIRSHRAEVPDYIADVVDDAWRIVGPLPLPDSAYITAAKLLNHTPPVRKFGTI